MQNRILEIAKEELQNTIENMEYSNISSTQDRINYIFSLLHTSKALPGMPETDDANEEISELPEPEIKKPAPEKTTPAQPIQKTEGPEDKPVYTFERKLRGGLLVEESIFVPENIVRLLDLATGDKVHAVKKSKKGEYPERYDYEVAEKADPSEQHSDIVLISHAIVEKDPVIQDYYIRTFIGENDIEEIEDYGQDMDRGLRLQDKDLEQMSIYEGDIVDAAFYRSNPSNTRVRWKHPIDTNEASTPKKSGYYKTNDKQTTEERDPVFEGKTILVIGGESSWSGYREEIESRSGEMITKSGSSTSESIDNAVSKSDCVINMIMAVSHNATNTAVASAKEHNVPYANVYNFGRSTFIREVCHLLNIEE